MRVAGGVSDFYRHLVLAIGVDGEAEEIVEVEGQPSGLGWMPDGSLLISSMKRQGAAPLPVG